MIVSVFVRRLKEGHTFEEFVEEWEPDPCQIATANADAGRPRSCTDLGSLAGFRPAVTRRNHRRKQLSRRRSRPWRRRDDAGGT